MHLKTKIVAFKVFQRIKSLELSSENEFKYQIIRIISFDFLMIIEKIRYEFLIYSKLEVLMPSFRPALESEVSVSNLETLA